MINCGDFIKENIKEHNLNWPQILDQPYRILLTRDPGSRKTNSLFHLIIQQPHIDKTYSYAQDPYEAKY